MSYNATDTMASMKKLNCFISKLFINNNASAYYYFTVNNNFCDFILVITDNTVNSTLL